MLTLILFLLSQTLFADLLNTQLPNLWDPECMSCIPRAMCPSPLMEDLIYVDLSNPIYSDGVLQTQQGGVIHTKDLRVQAQDILYINKDEQCTMFCQGNLLIDYKEWILTGESFFYDFASKTGYLIAGRTAAPPWYIGSKRMELRENGDVIVFGGYLTTSEGPRQDVRLLLHGFV